MNMPQSGDADAWTESMLDCYRDVLTRVLNMEWRLSENQRAELFSRLRTSLDCYRVLNAECLSENQRRELLSRLRNSIQFLADTGGAVSPQNG